MAGFKRAGDLQEIDPSVDGSLYLGRKIIDQLLPCHCRKGKISYPSKARNFKWLWMKQFNTYYTIPRDFQTILQMRKAGRADKSSHPVITDGKTDTQRCDMTCPKKTP